MKKIISDKLIPYEKNGETIYLTQDEYDAIVNASETRINSENKTTQRFTVPKFIYSNKELINDGSIYNLEKALV